jgi:aspartyl-tRNA(Asn)/glutamyl-tRNA(Gln) amidotransferase subunit B
MKYIPTIGLEIHAELRTKSKMFCSCANNTDEKRPNVNICPICLGHPGTLPVLNKEAIRHVLLVAHAVGGTSADYTEWDRKNYFYPDIPKGYQISQYKYPLVEGGAVKAGEKEIALTRIHLEEDTAKSTHGQGKSIDESLVDFNRAGVPLLELVTEPVIHDAETAGAFAREFQLLLRTLGVAEANMEKGEMRVEANVSVASEADTAALKFGTKTEVKNLNSFRSVERAIAFEIERQSDLLEKGEKVVQETRGWDENASKTFSQRAKESSHDYRYFPDPDLPKLVISEIPEFIADEIEKGMPELPWDKRARFIKDFKMTDKEAAVFVEAPAVGAYFESIIENAGPIYISRLAINYILSDYLGLIKKDHGEDYESYINSIEPSNFTNLMKMISENKVSSRGAKDLLVLMYKGDKREPLAIAGEKGLLQKSDEGELESMAKEIIAKNPSVVADYKAGKLVALQFLVGQGMKLSKGSANPEILKKVFLKELE